MVEDYLFRDILEFEQLRNARKLRDLTTLVAHQIGSELSLNELANTLRINRATVERYLDLLEKCFILYRASGFSGNLRKEVTKTMRYYFVDTGIRNAVIGQFQPIEQRADRGALWENYFVNERRRLHAYTNSGTLSYFWRTYDQQELDLIEVHPGGTLSAFECKWQNKKHRSPKAWQKAYPDTPVQFIHPQNYTEFLL